MNASKIKPLALAIGLSCVWAGAQAADPKGSAAPADAQKARTPAGQAMAWDRAEAAALVRDFEQAREAYLAKRAQLRQASGRLTEAQRQALREQLKALRAEQARAREELRQQLRTLREELPSHRDWMEQALEPRGPRPRRGD
jgi:predicted  nucleic acid-binding Zn-ribbon protein